MNPPVQIEIKISGAAAETLARLKDRAGVGAAVAGALDRENQLTVSWIQSRYMSFPKSGPPNPLGTRVQSNRLRGSLRASAATVSGGEVRSGIGSNVVYAAIQEFGGTTAPHVIRARNAKALHFNGIFRKSVKHPGSTLPARGMVRRGITDRLPRYSAALSSAIVNYASNS